MKHREI